MGFVVRKWSDFRGWDMDRDLLACDFSAFDRGLASKRAEGLAKREYTLRNRKLYHVRARDCPVVNAETRQQTCLCGSISFWIRATHAVLHCVTVKTCLEPQAPTGPQPSMQPGKAPKTTSLSKQTLWNGSHATYLMHHYCDNLPCAFCLGPFSYARTRFVTDTSLMMTERLWLRLISP